MASSLRASAFSSAARVSAILSINGQVEHYICDAGIVVGNSGAPVLDVENKVIGIAVKGLNIPGKFGDADQLSNFLPVDRIHYRFRNCD